VVVTLGVPGWIPAPGIGWFLRNSRYIKNGVKYSQQILNDVMGMLSKLKQKSVKMRRLNVII
jgi:hypothetical protein